MKLFLGFKMFVVCVAFLVLPSNGLALSTIFFDNTLPPVQPGAPLDTIQIIAPAGVTVNGVNVATTDDVNTEATARANADAAEAAARAAADASITSARAGADAAIQADVNANELASDAADVAEATARANADTLLQSNIDAISGADTNYLEKRIDDVDDRLDEVGALTSAFSALVPNARAKGNTQLSLGLGNYSGASAIAAGVFHYVSDNVLVNAGASSSFDSGETAARAGVTFGF